MKTELYTLSLRSGNKYLFSKVDGGFVVAYYIDIASPLSVMRKGFYISSESLISQLTPATEEDIALATMNAL